MMDFPTLTKAVADIVDNLTNVVGLVEKNINAYDRIAKRNREHRLCEGLDAILSEIGGWEIMNRPTLVYLGASGKGVRNPEAYEEELRTFLRSIVKAKELLEEYQPDIMKFDQGLFKGLYVGIAGREATIRALLSTDLKTLSPEKLEELCECYEALMRSLRVSIDRIQAKLNAQ